jgi:hypothetical protein
VAQRCGAQGRQSVYRYGRELDYLIFVGRSFRFMSRGCGPKAAVNLALKLSPLFKGRLGRDEQLRGRYTGHLPFNGFPLAP